jgi:phosphoglycolate phosphatase
MRYKAILFDLDGTLIDSLEDQADAINRVLTGKGFPTHDVNAYRYFIGDGVATLIARALPETDRDEVTIRACLTAFREDYSRNWKVKTKLYDGVRDLLNAVAARGVKSAVLSNKPDDFTKLCVKEFLADWTFDAALGERRGVPRKPDPAGALEIVARLNLPPSDFLYLGDSDVDMKTATAAGMFPVGALWGFRPEKDLREGGARVLLRHPLEMLDLLA